MPYWEFNICVEAEDQAEADSLFEVVETALGCGEGPDHICPHFRIGSSKPIPEEDEESDAA